MEILKHNQELYVHEWKIFRSFLTPEIKIKTIKDEIYEKQIPFNLEFERNPILAYLEYKCLRRLCSNPMVYLNALSSCIDI